MSSDGLTWIKHSRGEAPSIDGDAMVAIKWPGGSTGQYPMQCIVGWDRRDGPVEYAIVTPSPSTVSVLTGGSNPYYTIDVNGTTIECNDIIKALGLPYADGNVLKAVWRIAMDRMGKGKPGNTRLYDAEKIVFFGNDIVERERGA